MPHDHVQALQPRELAGHQFHGIIAGSDEGGPQQQVLRGVAADRKLGREDEPGAALVGGAAAAMIFCALPAMSPTTTLSCAVQMVSVISDMPDFSNDYVTRVLGAPREVDAPAWNALLALAGGSPFMRHEYLAALHDSGSATRDAGWTPQFVTLWREGELHAPVRCT
jgi:hypothetical protein